MVDADELSDRTLEATVEAATRFVLGVNGTPGARAILALRGLTDEELTGASERIADILQIRVPAPLPTSTPASRAQREAVVWIDEWDDPAFREILVILSNGFEGTRDWLFDGLQADQGPAATLSARTLCQRYRELELGTAKGREGMVAQDKAALARLAERGYGPEHIAEVEEKLAIAFGPTPAVAPAPEAEAILQARREKLVELKRWYDEWATTARTHIRRKAYLIAMGLATRRLKSTPAQPSEE